MYDVYEYGETTGFDWSDHEASRIERLNQKIGCELLRPIRTREGRRELKAFEHIGVIQIAPGRTVHVLPKIHRDTTLEGEERRAALQTLLRWLGYAGRLPFHTAEQAALQMQNPDWFEIMTRLFATNLRDEWRRGPVRAYVTHEDDRSPTLSGRWRITDQLRHPTEKSVFCVTRDEFSGDTPLNRILRFVVERLRKRTTNRENRALLDGLAGEMDADSITLVPTVTLADADPSRLLSRLNTRYAPLVTLARLFLSGGGLEMLSGRDAEDTWSFTLDMNTLFEEFIAGFLMRHRDEILPDALQDCTILPQAAGAKRHLVHREIDNKPLFKLEPDIALRDAEGKFPMLLDTKYKRLKDDARLGVAQSDLYQMFAYAHRFDCPRVVLLYPATGQSEIGGRTTFRFDESRCCIVATVDVRNPLRTTDDKNLLSRQLKELFAGRI